MTYNVQHPSGMKNLQTTRGSASFSLAYSGGISLRGSFVSSFMYITSFLCERSARKDQYVQTCLLDTINFHHASLAAANHLHTARRQVKAVPSGRRRSGASEVVTQRSSLDVPAEAV